MMKKTAYNKQIEAIAVFLYINNFILQVKVF